MKLSTISAGMWLFMHYEGHFTVVDFVVHEHIWRARAVALCMLISMWCQVWSSPVYSRLTVDLNV